MEIIYLAKEDIKENYFNIYVIEGEAWSFLFDYKDPMDQDSGYIMVMGGQ